MTLHQSTYMAVVCTQLPDCTYVAGDGWLIASGKRGWCWIHATNGLRIMMLCVSYPDEDVGCIIHNILHAIEPLDDSSCVLLGPRLGGYATYRG